MKETKATKEATPPGLIKQILDTLKKKLNNFDKQLIALLFIVAGMLAIVASPRQYLINRGVPVNVVEKTLEDLKEKATTSPEVIDEVKTKNVEILKQQESDYSSGYPEKYESNDSVPE